MWNNDVSGLHHSHIVCIWDTKDVTNFSSYNYSTTSVKIFIFTSLTKPYRLLTNETQRRGGGRGKDVKEDGVTKVHYTVGILLQLTYLLWEIFLCINLYFFSTLIGIYVLLEKSQNRLLKIKTL